VLSIEEILEKIDEAVGLGATRSSSRGIEPRYSIEYYEKMLKKLRKSSMSRCMHSLLRDSAYL